MMPRKPYDPAMDKDPNPHDIKLPLKEAVLTEQALIAADLGRSQTITEDGEIINTVTHEVIARAPPFFKTQWNHDTVHEALASAQINTEPSKTQQQFAKDADINVILAKFQQTGELRGSSGFRYIDVDKEFDLQSEMVTGAQVKEAWDALPAAARNILKDPKTFADYVDHCMETGDLEPLRELGLAKPKVVLAPEAPLPPPPPTGAGNEPKAGS